MAASVDAKSFVKTGEEYKESLRDGRVVYSNGEVIEDVTTHPLTRAGVQTLANLHDDHHEDELRDLLTYVRDDGARVTASYMMPRTPEELTHRREIIEHYSRRTFGSFGRGLDMIATLQLGFVAHYPTFQEDQPQYAENVLRYRDFAEENHFHLAETIADPQGFRARGGGTPIDALPPERVTTQIVKVGARDRRAGQPRDGRQGVLWQRDVLDRPEPRGGRQQRDALPHRPSDAALQPVARR